MVSSCVTAEMTCVVRNITISELTSWSVVHQHCAVILRFRRRLSGDRYITCLSPLPTYNKPLFISVESLALIMEAVSEWAAQDYMNLSLLNEWGLTVSQ